MNKLTKLVLIATPILAFSFASYAHEPKMHMKNAEKANCAPLEKMKKEGKKVDMKDPVMIAMMKKCDKQKSSEKNDGKHSEKMQHKEMSHKQMGHEKKTEEKHGDKDKHNPDH